MIYGLGTMFDFYKEVLRDAILISPCIYWAGTEEKLIDEFLNLKRAGVYYLGGEQWPETKQTICEKLSFALCTWYSIWPDELEASPFNSLQYAMQNYVEDQFAELIPIEEYAKGQRDSPPIDLGVIDDTFPITFIIGDEDQVCAPELSERIFDEFENADKKKFYERGFNHEMFGYMASDDFVDRMSAAIEGTA